MILDILARTVEDRAVAARLQRRDVELASQTATSPASQVSQVETGGPLLQTTVSQCLSVSTSCCSGESKRVGLVSVCFAAALLCTGRDRGPGSDVWEPLDCHRPRPGSSRAGVSGSPYPTFASNEGRLLPPNSTHMQITHHIRPGQIFIIYYTQ